MSTRAGFWRAGIERAVCVAVAAGIASLSPATAHADRGSLRARMARTSVAAERSGYSCRSAAKVVQLNGGQGYVLSTTLFRRNAYKLIGVGDDTVRDLDLELYDENWHLISRDTSTDNVPIVHVTPRWTGTFYYKIVAYSGHGLSSALICYRR